MAAATLLCISLLLVTEIRVHEVMAVTAWAVSHAFKGALFASKAFGRFVMTLFPEKSETEKLRGREHALLPVRC